MLHREDFMHNDLKQSAYLQLASLWRMALPAHETATDIHADLSHGPPKWPHFRDMVTRVGQVCCRRTDPRLQTYKLRHSGLGQSGLRHTGLGHTSESGRLLD